MAVTGSPEAGAQLRRQLALITLLTALPLGTLDILLPIYAQSLQASQIQIGLLFSFAAVVGLVLRPIAGALADRRAARLLLCAGATTALLAMLGYAVASSYQQLFWARGLHVTGIALISISSYVLIANQTLEHERARVFGRLTSLSFLGIMIGGVLAGAVLLSDAATQAELRAQLEQAGIDLPLPQPLERLTALHLLYSGYFVAHLLALVLALALLRQQRQPGQMDARARQLDWRRLIAALRPATRLLLLGFLLGMAYSLTTPILPIWFQLRFGQGLAPVALAYVIPSICYSLLPELLGRHVERWGSLRSIRLGLIARALAYLLLPLAPGLGLIALLLVVEAAGYSLALPALQALLARTSGQQTRGRLYGLYSLAAGLGGVLGGALSGWAYSQIDPAAPFWGQALLLLAGALIVGERSAWSSGESSG